ncbi:MAG: Type 1 glutamine amidotransferase-like domain-containing protein [Chloroflexi bacterium]|nr:Type 1 glutamine amidotransferase-like domain-containing protein [Chloroflexota bacterium]
MGAFPGWLDELRRRPRHAALVPTAANPLPHAPWVPHIARQLRAYGISVDYLDLERATPTMVATVLVGADLVFVTGGYPMFLLEQAQRTGFLELVRQQVHQGQLAYAGMSAGAALAGPDLALYQSPDDPGNVRDSSGLALVPFCTLSHVNRGRRTHYAKIITAHPTQRFVVLTDEQAVVIAGDRWQVRESLLISDEDSPQRVM